ncbi:MAG: LicD family protein [Eubacterium sp.]|nr:LicD family protein [Eubacterium sp.]
MENEIRYTVHGGTMIGIIREKGFIPWDDDIDVAMTRAFYNKLLKLMEGQDLNVLFKAGEGERFLFTQCHNPFPQLWMLRENQPAVWIDLFIYDGISEKPRVRKVKKALLVFCLGILKNKTTMELTKHRKLFSRIKYGSIYLLYLIGKPFSQERKYRFAEKIRQSFQGKGIYIHRSNDRYIGMKLVYPKEVMDEYVILPFADTELMVSADYDTILKGDFGDYMHPVKDHDEKVWVHDEYREYITDEIRSGRFACR